MQTFYYASFFQILSNNYLLSHVFGIYYKSTYYSTYTKALNKAKKKQLQYEKKTMFKEFELT